MMIASVGSAFLQVGGSRGMVCGFPMQALLDLLEHDPLMARTDVARLLGRSLEEVEELIAKLEADGVIVGYQTVINRDKWSPDLVTSLIEVRITPERDGGFDRIASRIAKFDEVQSCYLMSGGYDLLIQVEAGNLREVADFVARKLSTIEGVLSTATRFRLKTYKENGTFHSQEPDTERLSVTP